MSPIRFGILMVPYQTLDVAGPVDILSSCSRPYLEVMERDGQVSKVTAAAGLDIEFYYVGSEMKPVQHTGNLQALPTTTCDACPPLDYLLIGGPSPGYQLLECFESFIRRRSQEVKAIFTTCTGALLLAQTGLLDGRNATVNHVLLPQARALYPKVNWNDSQQWVTDGCFWTASGACAGMDMFAHWVMENCHPQVVKASFMILDYTPRDIHGQHLTIPTQ
jgi:transcriptional regulator GlxA family with amidase domain